MYVQDRGGTLKGASTVARCGLQAAPIPDSNPQIPALKRCQGFKEPQGS